MATADILTIAELWAEAVALQERLAGLDEAGRTDAEGDAEHDRMFALEDAVLVGPITSKADAIAKLKSAGLTFERGDRLDEQDGPAFAEAIAWLEAHP